MKRRAFMTVLAMLPAVKVERAAEIVARLGEARGSYAPRFFTDAEWRVVRVLAEDVLPKDERSEGATGAKVPEFMDVFLSDPEIPGDLPGQMRNGLRWLEAESRRRFGRAVSYDAASESQRHALLTDIAWPSRARAELRDGVQFFSRFRDLTASGFWSSPVGYRDLQFEGGVFVTEWKGCPDDALTHLGLKARGR